MNFITTTLPYANSVPHVGHALEFVQADFWRRTLNDVYLNIGLDEHGKKIYDTAISQGKDPQEFVNELKNKWVEFCELFQIKYDNFYRTSDVNHKSKVIDIWNKLLSENLIYLKDYKGKYCKGCEEFKTNTQIENDRCIDHLTIELEEVDEENFFFKLSKFKDLNVNITKTKSKELSNIIKNGVDVSISRQNIEWGINVPDSEHTIYVWFEALLNYIFANPDWNNNSNIQICGPDNLRFQGHFFQGLLQSLNLKQTDKLLVHGTILDSNGNKMSKSLGNTIDPVEQVEKYGLFPVRYYLLKGISTYDNSNWDEDNLINTYNSDIADQYGNLISRVLHLYNIKEVNVDPDPEYVSSINKIINLNKDNLLVDWDIQEYLKRVNLIVKESNKYINDEQPWKYDKPIVLSNLYYTIQQLSELYRPVFGDEKTDSVQYYIKLKEKQIFFPRI